MRGTNIKKTKVLFSYILLLFLFPLSLYSQSDTHLDKYVDSMMLIINKLDGSNKIGELDKLAGSLCGNEIGLPYINMLKEEAKRQSNKAKLGNAHYYHAEYLFWINSLYDSVLYYLDKTDEMDFKHLDRSVDRLRFTIYLKRKEYNYALMYIKKRLDDKTIETNSNEEAVLYCELGITHLMLKNYEESLAANFKALEIIVKDRDLIELEQYVYHTISDNYFALKEFDKALIYRDSSSVVLDRMEFTGYRATEDYKEIRRSDLIRKVDVYLAMNDLASSREYLDKIKNDSPGLQQNIYWSRYLKNESQYFFQKEDYKRALAYLDKYELSLEKIQTGGSEALDLGIMKAKVYNKLNRNTEAFNLLENAMNQKDSLNSQLVASTVAELQIIYEVSKLQSDIEVQKASLERSKAIVVGLFCVLLLSIGIVFLIRRNSKVKEKKNKKIYEQYVLMKSYMDEIKIQRNSLAASTNENNDEQTYLAEQAYEYIMKTEAFKDENLSRDELASILGTNREYLTTAIREKTGKTYKDYINTIRLDYAYQMLIKNKEESIESIYIDAGFPTRSTFNRLFREQYEMSPNELREAARQKEEQIISSLGD